MKRKHWWSAIILVVVIVPGIFIYKTYSRKQPTGWNYNDPTGGFEKIPYESNGEDTGLILIDGAEFTMGKDTAGNSIYILEGDTFTMGKIDSVVNTAGK